DPTVNTAVITLPLPPELQNVSASFTGGNVTPSYAINGSNLVVTTTAGILASQMQTPNIHITGTVDPATSSTALTWKTFSTFNINITLSGTTLDVSCAPSDLNQVLN